MAGILALTALVLGDAGCTLDLESCYNIRSVRVQSAGEMLPE